jgi:hypothetical protein
VADYLSESAIEKIIITQFELARYPQHDECYANLLEVIEANGIEIAWQEYAYGWELESFNFDDLDAAREELENNNVVIDSYGTKLAQGGTHSEVLPLDSWIYELCGHEIYLCGAFDGECLEDISLALSACDVNFERVNSLIL